MGFLAETFVSDIQINIHIRPLKNWLYKTAKTGPINLSICHDILHISTIYLQYYCIKCLAPLDYLSVKPRHLIIFMKGNL